jgi:cellobiose phosphorylase
MWVGPTTALALTGVVAAFGVPAALPAAAVVLLAWLLSPLVAHVISRPLPGPVMRLSGKDVGFLRRVARLTWRYFEVFVGPQENWLPPDNFQARPDHRVAHRTSPTDMGLSLLANLSAFDFGYLSGAQLVERTERIVDSMETLERHRGHFYNWYDTVTRRPLRPLYVSSVDSGNLVGHVRVLAAGLDALRDAPVLSARAGAGLADTLAVLGTLVERTPAFEALAQAVDAAPDTLSAQAPWLAGLALGAESVLGDPEVRLSEEAAWWANALARQIQALRLEIAEFAPCLSLPVDLRGAAWHRCVAALDGCATLRALGDASGREADASVGMPEAAVEPALFDALRQGAARVSLRLRALTALSERCVGLATADFSFLYDPDRMLFSIGFWVNERRLDASQYDLLASESRLASFVAIADGQVPFDHWFALGRRLTTALGRPVLLSWSGSMFEYLMPLLVMPGYRGTLLDVSCEAAVSRQIDYGRRRGVAWGISESCYDLVDAEGTYQYRAFGVPGLGLQRGLADDLVVAPYATVLALLVDPAPACANLQRLATEDCLGPYGFYEAVDHTAPRRTMGRRGSVIPTVMVHHQGMSLLALARTVLGPRMQARFLSVPEYRAAALLLQERVPAESVFSHPHALEAERSLRAPVETPPVAERTFTHPNTPVPEVHLLSNGRYQVMVSAAGGGYSRWGELALTRWREDPTSEAHGVFFYVSDLGSRRTWSNTFQPMLRVGRRPTAIFTTGRAEFRREDEHIETHTEIAVSTEDDVEVRRLRVQNRSTVTRTLVVTAFAEIVLAPGVTDELHRAFSNLFVEAEVLNEHGAILFTRRARSSDERPAWMFCLFSASGEAVGPCSATADRATFVGRGRSTRQPAALEGTHALDGADGAVLDPCAALRRRVTLLPDRSERLDLVIGAAATREAAFALMMKYKDHRMADRVFEGAATHGRVALNELGVTETQARCYERLAAAVLFPVRACRAPASVLRRNRKSQAGLWAHGISGDLPIVLLRMTRTEHLDVALDLLRAHAFWRTRGLAVDLVIWNEELSGYRNDLDDLLMGLLSRGPEAGLLDRPGGVFLRHLDGFDEADRVLLASVARIVVRDIDGPLEGQLEHWWRTMQISRASLLPPPPVETPLPANGLLPTETAHRADLRFANGHGGFTQDGREYIVDLSASHPTPAPWCNVIANERIGMVVSERGSACTWVGNAQLHRLTPWHNDAVGDPSGESLFLRDEATGRFFSPLPGAGGGPYTCRHGFGYSVFEHRADDLETRTTTFVHVDAPVKFVAVRVRNVSGRSRRLSVFAAFDMVLGDLRSRTAMHVVTEVEPLTGALLAQNAYGTEQSGALAFLDCSAPERSVSGDRVEWAGRNGDPACPAALRLRHLSGRVGAGFDPCLAMQAHLDVPAGEDREVVFILGAGADTAETMALLQRHRGVAAARRALEGVWAAWNDRLSAMHATTPDPALDVLFNGWLPYQILASRMWGRAGFHQSGGAFGFRDQLQDTTALLHMAPALARAHLLRCASRQFVEGDVQHWWHPGSGRGVRTRCVDDALWLPYAVHRYVTVTGDTAVLDERVPFLTGRGLEPGEESRYDLPGAAEGAESLYEHCVRTLGALSRLGEHGLPLIGSGDWNDGMNRVGPLGRGESVWMGFFGCEVLRHFAGLAEARADAATAARCRASAMGLAESLERHAWDGAWYRRAWFDDGTVLGTGGGQACEIDSLPQSWATLAGVGSEERRGRALDAIWDWLVVPEAGVVKLFTPPFDGAGPSAGYIGGYPRGVRENGGQYTHAALWAVMAFAKAGRAVQAERMLELINPVRHTQDGAGVARYRAEPYVIAADVYGEAPHAGRAGWTWYTGSAAWMYRLVHEVFFGLDRQGQTLHLDPRPPASWNTFTLNYRFGATHYRLDFVRAASADGRCRLVLDGAPRDGQSLGLVDDGQAHVVEIRFGVSPGVDGASGQIGLGSVSI